jgi:Transglutaminase-like superfamily/Domain of unknown function (DUF4129)
VGTADTPYAEAEALWNWFQTPGRFTYDITQNLPDNPHALYDFLTTTRTGYCQQFSFAMAVLARLLGIPARVAVGFNLGTKTSPGHYRIDGSDAHAWDQLYFSGYGWTTWDPTPPGNGVGQTNDAYPTYAGPTGHGGSSAVGKGSTSGNDSHNGGLAKNIERHLLGEPDVGGLGNGALPPAATPSQPGFNGLPIVLIVLGVLLVVAIVAPRTLRSVTRRRRWLTARSDISLAQAAWAELLDDMADYSIARNPGETPRALARRLRHEYQLASRATDALNRLAQAEERARYAPEPAPGTSLRADVATVRSSLASSVPRAARWRARLMPASSVAELRRISAHALDAFAWLEVAMTRLRSRLPHPRTNP